MGFNFGAFIGGLSQQLVSDIEREEERVAEMEKIAQTEAMRERAAAAASRRAKQETTEKLMGALSMFYTPDAAAEIVSGGETAAEFWLNYAQDSIKAGQNPMDGLRISGGTKEINDPEVQNFASSLVAPRAGISPTASVLGEAGTGTTTTIDTGPAARYLGMINPEAFSKVYGEPTDYGSTYTAALLKIDEKLAKETNPDKIANLKAERERLLANYEELRAVEARAGQEPSGPTSAYNMGTLNDTVSSALRNAYKSEGLRVNDITGELETLTEGQYHIASVAELRAAETLQSTNNYFEDRAMQQAIDSMRLQATRRLIDYGRSTVAEGTSSRLKREINPTTQTLPGIDEITQKMQNGEYKIGDVVMYQDDGDPQSGRAPTVRFVVITGIPNLANDPWVVDNLSANGFF